MPGFSANIINLISDNLRDRYQSGFPIIKELIQNADDAYARRFVFGDHSGFVDAEHPLLQGPGLFFFNDGTFKESDKKAISSFAENSKAGEEGTIGKFGLGMKSVFHLCEAFFYVAYDGNFHSHILNPWDTADGNLHPEWETVQEDDWQRLANIAKDLVEDSASWFFLWIPLRKKNHLQNEQGETGSIIERFPGDSISGLDDMRFLNEPSLKSTLAAILPLLQALEIIEYSSSQPSSGFLLTLKSDGRLERDVMEANSTGEVILNKNTPLIAFHGKKQQAASNSSFYDLKNHSKWPKTFCRDEKGHQQPAPDKSRPEGAILISNEDQRPGLLSIQWSLFLPLDDKTHQFEVAIEGSSRHYRIFLHGQFFVDAGRKGIYEYSSLNTAAKEMPDDLDEAGLRRRWNQELAHKVSLPLLLPTLAEFVHLNALSDGEIGLLTEAICRASSRSGTGQDLRQFIAQFKQAVCQNCSWVRVISRTGPSWELINNRPLMRLLPLPSPPKVDPSRPWLVLPHLDRLDDTTVFVDADAPRISNRLEMWTEDELITALGGNTCKTFTGQTTLDYLSEFIEKTTATFRSTDRLQMALLGIVRDAFRQIPLADLRRNKLRVSRIVGFILPKHRLAIGALDPNSGKAVPDDVFESLWNHDSRVLIVPKDLDFVQSPGEARPEKEDVGNWLKLVHKHIVGIKAIDSSVEKPLEAATQLLESLGEPERARILGIHNDLRVISATDPCSNRTVAVSFSMLNNARQRENLFGFSQNLQQLTGMTRFLADALPDESIYLLKSDIHKMLFSGANVPSSTAGEAVLRSIGIVHKTLGSESARYALIGQADDPDQDKIARRGLRYLLHGDPEHFSDEIGTLWVAQRQHSPAWEKLWRQVTGIEGQNSWNVLKKVLAERVHQNRWECLGIREIQSTQVITELRRVGPKVICPDEFSDSEREEILTVIDDKSLWLSLPLHLMQNGDKGPIGDQVYLDVGRKLPAHLSSDVTVAVLSGNSFVAKKQQDWVPHLDDLAIISLVLKQHEAGRHWRFIVETIHGIPSGTLAAIQRLRDVPWLPLRSGGFVSPEDVIDLPFLDTQIQLLASKAEYCFASVVDLNEEILRHRAFEKLRLACFAVGRNAVVRLGLLMAELPDYAIGKIEIPKEDRLGLILPILAKLRILPAWKIVEEVVRKFTAEACIELLIPELTRPISQDRMVQVLNTLADDAAKRVQGAEPAFNLYLRSFCNDQGAAKLSLPHIKLRSRGGDWRCASELCVGATDISENFLLDEGQASILSSTVIDAGHSSDRKSGTLGYVDIDLALQSAPNIFKDYFQKWAGLAREESIGALLCLMGRRNRDLAEHYLGGFSFDGLIEQVGWKVPDEIDFSGRREWMYGMSAVEAFNTLEVAVRTVNENEVLLTSLTGTEIKVPLSKKITTIIAGAPWWGGGFKVYLPLRRFSVGDLTPEELSSLLRRTAEYILDKCYNQRNVDLGELWQELDKSDQLEIEVARGKILNNLPFYLRQLNAHHNSRLLRQALDDCDHAQERFEELKLSRGPSADKLKKLTFDIDSKRHQLAKLFTDDDAAQHAVLKALRLKLSEFQYSIDCIPFELFQNADDSIVELGKFVLGDHGEPTVPVSSQKIAIEEDNNLIRFMHWGRLINAPGPLAANGEASGYRRDLEKMLVLSSSDKPIGEGVTGKFGLGFKSVFLCCQRPRMLSGNLRVEIIGGVLPQLWSSAQTAAARLEAMSEDRRYRGTVTELQLNDDVTADGLLARFNRLAGLLCIFGRAIRRVDISRSGEIRQFSWDPSYLGTCTEVGNYALWRHSGWTSEVGIVFRFEDGTILLPLSPTGFTLLPEGAPSIWVTAPTQEPDCLGFAISASFAIDAGRGKLASDPVKNIKLAQRLGIQVGAGLVRLKKRLEDDWTQGKRDLGLADGTTMAELWASLWRTLSKAALSGQHEAGAAGICREFALKVLEKICPAGIPNGLPYPYGRLIALDNVKNEIGGAWGRREAIEWLSRRDIQVEHCVMDDITILLRKLDRGRSITRVTFELLIRPLPGGNCREEQAECLENLAQILWTELPEEERSSASAEMAKLKFQSKAEQWVDLRFLLNTGVVEKDREEDLRIAFAPDNSLLSDAYSEAGRSFFKRCRPRYEAPTETLASWVQHANSESRRQAALRYLVSGELGHKICVVLRGQGLLGTWLGEINLGHEYLKNWNDKDKSELLRMLAENIYFTIVDSPATEPLPVIDTKKTLNAIYEWWQREGELQTTLYERRVYPQGTFPSLEFEFLKREPEARKGWLTLLLLGACHTKGRSNPEQHRAFVASCHSNGWMDKFVTVGDAGIDGWMIILKEYLEKGIEDLDRYHWMREFVSIFLLSYWLDEYVEGFSGVNRMQEEFSLSDITRLRASHHFKGGGAAAPPINQALGMGSCFVIRELVRKGFVTNKFAYPHCYVPKGSVREFLTRLGCDGLQSEGEHGTRSKMIYQFLVDHLGPQKATFGNSFDLPILAVANNVGLQHQLFQTTILNQEEIGEDDNGE